MIPRKNGTKSTRYAIKNIDDVARNGFIKVSENIVAIVMEIKKDSMHKDTWKILISDEPDIITEIIVDINKISAGSINLMAGRGILFASIMHGMHVAIQSSSVI